jgi:nuclear transport factor 2 (NTF2) superfamily protein
MHPAALPIRTKHIIPAEQVQALLVRKRARELDYRLI